jgi:small-conductance mechanosensitive channel
MGGNRSRLVAGIVLGLLITGFAALYYADVAMERWRPWQNDWDSEYSPPGWTWPVLIGLGLIIGLAIVLMMGLMALAMVLLFLSPILLLIGIVWLLTRDGRRQPPPAEPGWSSRLP